MKENLKYILILAGTILLVALVEFFSPKPIDWTPTFSQQDKNPFGSYIVYTLLPDIFPKQTISSIEKTLYERQLNSELTQGNYLFVVDEFNPGKEDIRILLELVDKGSHAFIAANYFSNSFQDTLGFNTSMPFTLSDTVELNLTHPSLKRKDNYLLKRVNMINTFVAPDSVTHLPFQVLGTTKKQQNNFVRIQYGKGYFYLNSVPLAYTNYNMLFKQNAEYISKTLSYLPVQPTFWNEHYNSYEVESQSPLRFIVSQPPLRSALYLSLVALVLFMIFEAKRKQRIIPIVKPLANHTLEFTQTVGRLYYQSKDHKNIAEKKITYFLDFLRTHFYLQTATLDDEFCAQLAQKSGIEQQKIAELFRLIGYIRSRPNISEDDLLNLNKQIEAFHEKSDRK